MTDAYSESKCLASLAVFRELYDGRRDIYSILNEFIKDIIISQGKYHFSLSEISTIFNAIYEFKVPEAVIKTALGKCKHIKKDDKRYIVSDEMRKETAGIQDKQSKIYAENEIIIDRLVKFINDKANNTLTNSDKTAIVHSFCNYLLEDGNGGAYQEYISAFIVENEEDSTFASQLNLIKEGVILYSGIKFTSNLADIGAWRTRLVIFLDTEIIFHLAGFNGQLFKDIFDELFSLIREINSKGKTRLISLRYFREVKEEIERYFTKAEKIVQGVEALSLKGTAMLKIIDGCASPSDVIQKQAELFSMLSTLGILEDDFTEYYSELNHKYNIADKNTVQSVSQELGIEDASEAIRFLNYVRIRRADGSCNSFENMMHILLTGKSQTLQLAWNEKIRENGSIPLATSINFLTNKFWFKLNKGFGTNTLPKSFNVIAKAQIILSAQLSSSISHKYDELQARFKGGALTERQAVGTIVALRKKLRGPEEISSIDVSEVLDVITEDSIERYIQEHEHAKASAEGHKKENQTLKQALEDKESRLEEYRSKEKTLVWQSVQLKQKLIRDKEELIQAILQQKTIADSFANKKYVKFKIIIAILLFAYFILSFLLIKQFTWNEMEQWTYLVSGLIIEMMLPFLYLLIFEKTFNPAEYLQVKKTQYQQDAYRFFKVDVERLEQLEADQRGLEAELATLSA